MNIEIRIDVADALRELGEMRLNLEWESSGFILDQDLREGLSQAVDIAKEWVPVDTGRLKDSIRLEGELFSYDFIADAKNPRTGVGYGGFVEHGTRFQPSQPYMRPALDSVMPEILERMKEDIRNLVKAGR